mmetsp:Transcript_19508/g.65910  ORF Transcript_19508/g.65910 Transcript_19508/m.65910 type:complete len:242 (-) Transcript_19508:1048-1773(-)
MRRRTSPPLSARRRGVLARHFNRARRGAGAPLSPLGDQRGRGPDAALFGPVERRVGRRSRVARLLGAVSSNVALGRAGADVGPVQNPREHQGRRPRLDQAERPRRVSQGHVDHREESRRRLRLSARPRSRAVEPARRRRLAILREPTEKIRGFRPRPALRRAAFENGRGAPHRVRASDGRRPRPRLQGQVRRRGRRRLRRPVQRSLFAGPLRAGAAFPRAPRSWRPTAAAAPGGRRRRFRD